MIGQTVRSQPRAKPGVLVLAFAGVLLAGWAVQASDVDFAIASILPFAIALILWAAQSRSLSFDLGDSGLDLANGDKIPYATMEGLWIAGATPERNKVKLRRGPITLMHEHGVLHIPACLSVRSDDLYRFLLDRCSPAGSRDVNEFLAEHLRREIETFGEDRVFSYRARRHPGESGRPRGGFAAAMLGLLIAGLAWIAIGEVFADAAGWFPFGVACSIASVLALTVERICRGGLFVNKLRRGASLIISPRGIAMVQGEIKGSMSWEELVDVCFVGRKRFLDATNLRAILLSVEASKFLLLDIYDCPVQLIHRRIMAYWKRPALAAADYRQSRQLEETR